MTDKDYHPDGFVPMSMTVTPLEEFTFMPNGNGLFTFTVPAQGQVFQKPLTEDQVSEFTHLMVLACGVSTASADINIIGLISIVRAIERAHGII